MREILFRGKHLYTGEWVEGWFVGKSRKAPYDPPQKDKPTIIDKDMFCSYVVPETIGQYTGITDSNGKKIFEGDVVAIDYEKVKVKGFVQYQGAAFYVATNSDLWEIDNYCSLWLLGNKYDNPELLEVG